ncbi:MAG TPA: MFS transporter [Pseudonocardiaceae bacterium]|jgi:EmrB/QacA subfamily drug resistance transporter|nr:MFS transporter [Pseudonocardiaceae bacterium]
MSDHETGWRERAVSAASTGVIPSTSRSPAAQAENPHHAHRWLILAVVGMAQLMVTLDVTIVNIALPSAQQALGFSDDSRQWIITAYSLAFGSLLLLGGRVSDLFGRKGTLLIGLVGFAAASAVGGAATSFAMLVAARASQGVFGAILAPAALSLLTTTFTEGRERGTAFGAFGAIAGSGAGVGLLLGGALTDWLSWRWCLYVNLVFAALAVTGALALLHNVREATRPHIDVPGALSASAALFAVVFGFSNAQTHGWSAGLTIAMLIAGAAILCLFVLIQARVRQPLLPLRVVLDRTRGGSYLAIGIGGAGMFGIFLFLTYYLQRSLGYSPLRTGIAFLPLVAAIIIAATIATSRVMPRTGPKPLVVAGMLLAALAMSLLTQLSADSAYVSHVMPPLLIGGLGFGMIMAPSIASATHGLRAADAGVGSAMVTTMQQIGGSLAVALLSTLAADSATNYLTSHAPPTQAIAAQAAIHGYHTAFWIAAAMFLGGAILSGALLPRGVRPSTDASPAAA